MASGEIEAKQIGALGELKQTSADAIAQARKEIGEGIKQESSPLLKELAGPTGRREGGSDKIESFRIPFFEHGSLSSKQACRSETATSSHFRRRSLDTEVNTLATTNSARAAEIDGEMVGGSAVARCASYMQNTSQYASPGTAVLDRTPEDTAKRLNYVLGN